MGDTHMVRWIARALLFAILVQFASGCRSKPTEETRQNRRLVDSLLTALITGNQKQLEKCKGLLDERHAAGLLSETNHNQLTEIFELARAGKSGEANEALNAFRKSQPFPQ